MRAVVFVAGIGIAIVGMVLVDLIKPALAQSKAVCATQLALANQACSVLPMKAAAEMLQLTDPDAVMEAAVLSLLRQHGHRHHGHKEINDDDDDGGGDDDDDDNHHRRRHRKRKHHSHMSDECCWWLREVDNMCVCEVLIRIPRFLTSSRHNYTLAVADACKITYQCLPF